MSDWLDALLDFLRGQPYATPDLSFVGWHWPCDWSPDLGCHVGWSVAGWIVLPW